MSRAFASLFVVLAAGCATVSGLADKEVVDCPGGCPDAGATTDTGTPVVDGSVNDAAIADAAIDTGPPPCDPTKDVQCMQLPAGGWSLVARAPLAGAPPPCPTGFASPANVGESPSAQFNACTCDSCTVTTPASCAGTVAHGFSAPGGACGTAGSPTNYSDPVPGQCQTDLYTGFRSSPMNEFTLPAPSGGACNPNAPVVHPERFTWSSRAVVCDGSARCSQGICDGRVDSPFAVCVVHDGVADCPAGFGDRHVVGTQGDADCAPTCNCSLTRAPCSGTITHYTDGNCMNGAVTMAANGTCLAMGLTGSFDSYKVAASSATTCNTTGSSAASNARAKDARTVCCR